MTDNLYDNIDDLLVKVLLQEASEAELDRVQHWVSLSPANERYLADFRKIWEESRHLAIRSTVNEDDAWRDFQRRVGRGAGEDGGGAAIDGRGAGGFTGRGGDGAEIFGDGAGARADGEPGGKAIIRKMTVPGRGWLRVAAVLLVIFAGAWLYYRYGNKGTQFIAVHSDNRVLTDTLPEGSVVTLNKQSSIRYKEQFAGTTRSVEVEGEAFFDVKPDKNKPFMVYSKGVLIKVIGTSFNVKASTGGTEVIVETGKVEVTSDRHTIRLGSHEKALVKENNSAPVKEENKDDLYNYYRTNEFECNAIPLGRLVEKLNEVYKVHIVITNDSLRELSLTTTFRDESLDEILYVITRTLKITFTRNGSDIILH